MAENTGDRGVPNDAWYREQREEIRRINVDLRLELRQYAETLLRDMERRVTSQSGKLERTAAASVQHAEFEQRFSGMVDTFNARAMAFTQRVDTVDHRLAKLEDRLDEIDGRLQAQERGSAGRMVQYAIYAGIVTLLLSGVLTAILQRIGH